MRAYLTTVLVTLCLGSGLAGADPQRAEDKAAADAVFDQAKQLLAAGDVAKACSMFEASLKLADQLGTRLNLADCYDKLGRTASAWAEFREAASLAHKRDDKREAFARGRADALQPRLAKLVIAVPAGARVPGLSVTRDGAAVAPQLYGTEMPVDPGKHTIAAAADGYKPWSAEIEAHEANVASIQVPALEAAPRPLVTGVERDPAAEARHARKTRQVIGLAVGGVGIAAVGASVVLGLQAKGKWDDAQAHCNGSLCDAQGVQLNQDAHSMGDVSTIVFGVGAAAIAAGVVVYLTAPKAPRAEQPAVALWPERGGVSLSVAGRF